MEQAILHAKQRAWLFTSQYEGGLIRYEEERMFGCEPKFVPLHGITKIAQFMDDIGSCTSEFVGMEGKQVFKRLTPTDIKAEMEGLGVDLLPDEWRMAGVISSTYAMAINQYRNKEGVPPPYGFDKEESDRLNAELLANTIDEQELIKKAKGGKNDG